MFPNLQHWSSNIISSDGVNSIVEGTINDFMISSTEMDDDNARYFVYGNPTEEDNRQELYSVIVNDLEDREEI